ncbi:MAG: NAD-binding protein, partial [Candidatus Adiutrix sp.]
MRVIVIGAGEVGYHIAARLIKEKAEVVIIDTNPQRLEEISETLDVQTVLGFGSNPETLAEAGLKVADMVVAVTGQDETNILACRMAQLLAPSDTRRIARIRASGYYEFFDEKKFRSDFGINFIINPSQEAVTTIMGFIEFPGVSDVIEVAGGQLRLVGLRLPKNHQLLEKPLSELFPHNSPDNILLAAIYRNHNLLIPRGDTMLKAGDLVYVVAPKIIKQESAAKHFYNLDPKPIKTVTIVGGGEVGYLLAKRLENDDRHFNVKLIEQKTERCLYL